MKKLRNILLISLVVKFCVITGCVLIFYAQYMVEGKDEGQTIKAIDVASASQIINVASANQIDVAGTNQDDTSQNTSQVKGTSTNENENKASENKVSDSQTIVRKNEVAINEGGVAAAANEIAVVEAQKKGIPAAVCKTNESNDEKNNNEKNNNMPIWFDPTASVDAVNKELAFAKKSLSDTDFSKKINMCKDGVTGLMIAAAHMNFEWIKAFMAYKEYLIINETGKDGDTALHLACYNGGNIQSTVENTINIVKFLIDNGANVNIKNTRENKLPDETPNKKPNEPTPIPIPNETPMHRAMQIPNTEAWIDLRMDVIELLRLHGGDINTPDRYGNTILHIAVSKNEAFVMDDWISSLVEESEDLLKNENKTVNKSSSKLYGIPKLLERFGKYIDFERKNKIVTISGDIQKPMTAYEFTIWLGFTDAAKNITDYVEYMHKKIKNKQI